MNAIIFDFDGTIADSFDEVLNYLLKVAGRDAAAVGSDERQKLKNFSMKDLALQVGVPAWRLPFLYFQGRAALTKRMSAIPVFTGMDTVLKTLHSEDYRLFIISSNSRRNIERFLTQHGLSGYFVRVYGNVGWLGKGSILRKALRRNQLAPATTVYVGDEVRDIVGAKLADMPSMVVNWGFGTEKQLLMYSPTVLVRSPAELQKALVDWGKSV